MVTHKFNGGNLFYEGLPTRDLDEDELSPDGQTKLWFAIREGLYTPLPNATIIGKDSNNEPGTLNETEKDTGSNGETEPQG